MMRICFFTHYVELLGANRSLLLLLDFLIHQKKEVVIHVVVPSMGSLTEILHARGISYSIIPFHFSYCNSTLNWKGRAIEFKNFLQDLSRLYQKRKSFQKFDIIYSNSSVIAHGWFLAKLLSKKHIWHIREYGLEDYNLVPVYGSAVQNYLMKKSDRVIFISHHLKNKKKDWFVDSKNAPVIYNGIELSDDIDYGKRSFDSKNLKFCFAGLMSEKKNPVEGLDLIEVLEKEDITSQYFIFSNMIGSYAEVFMNEVKNRNLEKRVHYRGFVNNLKEAIKDFDFLLMPSRNEAFGRVSIEAMSVGVPVIGYKRAGTTELFEDMVSGIYYNDITEIVNKIKKLTREDYMKLRQNAYDITVRKFDLKEYGEKVYNVCYDLLKS